MIQSPTQRQVRRQGRRAVVGTLLALAVCSLAACNRGDDAAEGSGAGTQVPAPTAGETGTAPSNDATAPAPTIVVDPTPVQPPAERDLAVRLGLAPARPLVVSHMLTHADVRELTGYTGELSIASIEGVQADPSYNTIRLAATTDFGFAAQVWRLDSGRQATARFERLSETYIIATDDPTPVGEEAFLSSFQGIRTYVFLRSDAATVGAVSCSASLCNEGQVRALAERVSSRM